MHLQAKSFRMHCAKDRRENCFKLQTRQLSQRHFETQCNSSTYNELLKAFLLKSDCTIYLRSILLSNGDDECVK